LKGCARHVYPTAAEGWNAPRRPVGQLVSASPSTHELTNTSCQDISTANRRHLFR
jgi:hypothetical protein